MDTQPPPTMGHDFETPRWVHDAVFYQIFPDRFARSDRVPKPSNLESWEGPPTTYGYKGGDLLGIAEHLDYLQAVGVTAIYLNPVFKSTANHRYHTYDYREVDPILGGDSAFQFLLDEAHRRNMRVILDGVFNHVGRGFYQFSHLLENGEASPYLDWFTVTSWPLNAYAVDGAPPGYKAWWGYAALPELDTGNPAVRDYLWEVAEHWTRRGIDGWRLDVPNEIDHDFWREFRRRVKAVNPEAYIVGEIWDDAGPWLQGDEFDGVMNYLFTRACLGFFAPVPGVEDEMLAGTGLAHPDRLDAETFRDRIDSLVGAYPRPATLAQLNLLDSHDTPRFLSLVRGDQPAFELATLFQMTFPGAPCVYYGDEIGMEGGRDPECRRAFPWDTTAWNEDLLAYVKRCVALRHAHPVLRTGDYTSLYSANGVYAFLRTLGDRTLGDEAAVVALNTSDTACDVNLDLPAGAELAAGPTSWGGPAPDSASGAIRGWRLPPRTGDVVFAKIIGTRRMAQ